MSLSGTNQLYNSVKHGKVDRVRYKNSADELARK